MNSPLYVVARTRDDFERWCFRQSPSELPQRVKFVANTAVLQDLVRPDVLFLEGWQSRPDWRKVYDKVLSVGGVAR